MVHLSNVLLCGVARRIGQRLGVPVVCTLSGEDTFLERLPQPYRDAARAALRERAADLAALVAMNGYYADFMAQYLGVPRERIHVIPPGLNLRGHGTRQRSSMSRDDRPFTIGFLARICPDKGLHQLLDAWRLLAGRRGLAAGGGPGGRLPRPGRPPLPGRLRSGNGRLPGWPTGSNTWASWTGRRRSPSCSRSTCCACRRCRRESKGLAVLEAWANGVPAVLPAHGAFSELMADTGGGLLYASRAIRPRWPPACGRSSSSRNWPPSAAAGPNRRSTHAIMPN